MVLLHVVCLCGLRVVVDWGVCVVLCVCLFACLWLLSG